MRYKGLVSSDWNECLAPSSPFDPISFAYPTIKSSVFDVFTRYTGNEISLGRAIRIISALMPDPMTEDQMDAYLDGFFTTYRGVPELIEWCWSRDILFMLNTTGLQGYFQRAFAKHLLPSIPIVAANPLVRYPEINGHPRYEWQVAEIQDKPQNTESVMRVHDIPGERVVIIGDSGGDGPHFEWGSKIGALLIGSMTKRSLHVYCRNRGISIDQTFGLSYLLGEERDRNAEMQVNFMELTELLTVVLDL